MAPRRARRKHEDLGKLLELINAATYCCCPECGTECDIRRIIHVNGLEIGSIEFTCEECGDFIVDHDPKKGTWKLRESGLHYLPNCDGNNLTIYQRFDENSYATRKEALEEKYRIMDSILQPILDTNSYELFYKIDDDLVECCRELSDMGIAKYKGILARLLLTSNVGKDPQPVKRPSEELLEEIESLVRETDYYGMSEAVVALYSYEAIGLESGVDMSKWSGMLVDRCIEESESLDIEKKVKKYLDAIGILSTIGHKPEAHELAWTTVDLIKKNRSTLEYADELLSKAYKDSCIELNTFDMAMEFFEHEDQFSDYDEYYSSAIFGLCIHAKDHPEIKDQVLERLDDLIRNTKNDDDKIDCLTQAYAHSFRYTLTKKTIELQKAFNIVLNEGGYLTDPALVSIVIGYLEVIRNDKRRLNKALDKLGMQGLTVDNAIEELLGSHNLFKGFGRS